MLAVLQDDAHHAPIGPLSYWVAYRIFGDVEPVVCVKWVLSPQKDQ
jgi:hypothetical protein